MATVKATIVALATSVAILQTTSAHAALSAHVDRTELIAGETVRLSLQEDDLHAAAVPDLMPLEKDFEILDVRQSRQISISGGRQEVSQSWIVTLLPRAVGALVIPEIRAGASATRAIPIEIVARERSEKRPNRDLFLEVEVAPGTPYVQAETVYSVRVFDGLGLRSATLREPQIQGARVESFGEPSTREEILDGRRYQVHEQRFAITPTRSGTLAIPPAVLEGRITDPDARSRFGGRDLFSDFFAGQPFGARGGSLGSSLLDQVMDPGRRIRVASQPLSLEVKPRPGGAEQGWFLPAKNVDLVEEWTPATTSLQVGDAITRKVTLRVLGATAEQLPAFVIPGPEGARQYEEGKREGTQPSDLGTVSVREQKVTILPTQSGVLKIPALEIPWFDTENETSRIASLPPRTFEVLPVAQSLLPNQDTAAAPVASIPTVTAALSPEADENMIPAALAIAAAFGTGIAAAWIFLRWRNKSPRKRALIRHGAHAVEVACRAGDGPAAREAFLAWGRLALDDTSILEPLALARRLQHPKLEESVRDLEAALFSRRAEPWSGKEMRTAFREARRQAPRDRAPSIGNLPALYPQS